ncbi:MAG: hypothetical protein QM710_11260 [Flavobacterium sp.]
MKSTIIFLGLAALSFSTVNAAAFKSQDLDQQELATLTVENTQQSQVAFVNEATSSNIGDVNTADTAVFSPSSVVESTVKTIDEVIAENKQVTESKDEAAQPLSLGYTIEDRIAEDNQIIESTVSNETFALDFKKINRNAKPARINNSALKTTDLKL